MLILCVFDLVLFCFFGVGSGWSGGGEGFIGKASYWLVYLSGNSVKGKIEN